MQGIPPCQAERTMSMCTASAQSVGFTVDSCIRRAYACVVGPMVGPARFPDNRGGRSPDGDRPMKLETPLMTLSAFYAAIAAAVKEASKTLAQEEIVTALQKAA